MAHCCRVRGGCSAGAALLIVPVSGVPQWKSWLLLGIGVLTLGAAIRFDIQLFQQECRILSAQSADLPEFLRSHGLTSAVDTSPHVG